MQPVGHGHQGGRVAMPGQDVAQLRGAVRVGSVGQPDKKVAADHEHIPAI